ncbi:MAG TPA: class I SAM-dependent methyltransferase, partial [Saprospiraceae bacterium]|nr:class I SAM-dependent methyltransferase [Saprospiraceae bacterium]
MSIRKLYYALPPGLRLLARKLYYLPVDVWASVSGKRGRYEPPRGDIYIGSGDFIQQGRHQLDLLQRYIDLQAADAVLDVGSGIGRTAVALTTFLNLEARYEGFDVVEKGVAWCNATIRRDFPDIDLAKSVMIGDAVRAGAAGAAAGCATVLLAPDHE